MAITLNSVAQGYITDAIADMLRHEGFESAVVDLGEFRTLGRHPDGRPWRIGIRSGKAVGGDGRMVELTDMALAVSGGYGTPFEPSGRFHHIFDPHSGASANGLVEVAVIGPRATAANALSTAICVAGETRARELLSAYPGMQAILTRPDRISPARDREVHPPHTRPCGAAALSAGSQRIPTPSGGLAPRLRRTSNCSEVLQ